jgi:hypothetical protein
MDAVNDGERQRRLRHAMLARVNKGWDVSEREPFRYLLGRMTRDRRYPILTVLAVVFAHQPPVRPERGVLSVDEAGEILFDRWWVDEERPR